MSNQRDNKPPMKKNEQDEEGALNQTQEEPKKEINEALKDHLPEPKKFYIYPENYLFTKAKQDLLNPYLKGNDFAKNKRSYKRLPNFQQKHYIRVNIKRIFMNRYLLKAFNAKLKKNGFYLYFEKFPQRMAINVSKDLNKTLMNMRLKEIFRAKELYEERDNLKYQHNLKIVDEIEKNGNPELNMILNRKLCCLFEEYLNSEEFGKIELNRLKRSNNRKDEYYIKKYVYLAKNFIEFCEN
jgi:hypothetical protein